MKATLITEWIEDRRVYRIAVTQDGRVCVEFLTYEEAMEWAQAHHLDLE